MLKKLQQLLLTCLLTLPGLCCLGGGVRVGTQEVKRIVCPGDAAPTVRFAACELRRFIKAAAGCELEIAAEPDASCANIILGEDSELLADLPMDDSYRIVCRDGNLHIAGHDHKGAPVVGVRNPWEEFEVFNHELGFGYFGLAGTLYGTYHFLEEFAGIRFYWPGVVGTVIPEKPIDINVDAATDISRSPAFSYRNPWFSDFSYAPDDGVWYRRAGFGGQSPVQIIDYFYVFDKHALEHPEIFALVDGERDTDKANAKCASNSCHLCMTNPETIRIVAEDIKEYFRHNDNQYFPLVPGDCLRRTCGCDKCQAEVDNEAPYTGRFSYHVWKFVNAVAREVAREFPGRFVGCLAYDNYLDPPVRLGRLEPNVAVMLCKRRSAMACPEYARQIHQRDESWLALKPARMFNWDYYLHTWKPWDRLPVFYPRQLQDDIRYEASHGFFGDFIEAEPLVDGPMYSECQYVMGAPGMQHLMLYLTGRLMWNPDTDVQATLDEYYRLFYGPAEEPMRAFFEKAVACWEEANRNVMSPKVNIWDVVAPKDVFTPEVVTELMEKLTEARRLAPMDSLYSARIGQIIGEFQVGIKGL